MRRFLPALAVLSFASFLLGTRFIATRPAESFHPLTGRVIPGIATDVSWMDRLRREREEAPDLALKLAGIAPGMSVADVGAGSGYMTIRLAKLVTPSGKVYANDLQPAMLNLIGSKARELGLTNIETIQGTEEDARLPLGGIDVVLLVDTYHELHRPQPMLASIRRALRPDGRLVVIEYRKEDMALPIATPHRMSVAELRQEVEAAGFSLDRSDEQLPRQHVIVFRKSGR